MKTTLERIRDATRATPYEGRLYLVGGILRDRVLGLPPSGDADLVLEGDAVELAEFLAHRGLSDHAPVLYPRFGTAMLSLDGHQIELVSARAESYDPGSRKPTVRQATIKDDVLRRDFTINTLLENLHTGEMLDLTGTALIDIEAGLIRTPLDPRITFFDDPLRMMRAVRFAVRFGFEIERETCEAIRVEARRLNLMGPVTPVVSAERIRDEFVKMLMSQASARAMELLREMNLLKQFLPEMLAMVGCTQNAWHIHDVWEHTLTALRSLPADAPLDVRLGLLLHDIGKPATRTEDERGVHFYEHQFVGAEMARVILNRLRFSNEEIRDVCALVELHMRPGEARPEWSDAAMKRLIRAVGPYAERLFVLSACDMAAMNPEAPTTDLGAVRARMDELNRQSNVAQLKSPLDGRQVMQALGVPPGLVVKEAKEFLTNEVIEGRLAEGDAEAAREALLGWWKARGS